MKLKDNPEQFWLGAKMGPVLSREETRFWIGRSQDLSLTEAERVEARNRVVEGHLRIALRIAKPYYAIGPSFNRDDVIQAGVMGLMRATEKFDLQKGTEFSTYAVGWVRQSIGDLITTWGPRVRLPHYMAGLVKKALKNREKLEQCTTDEERFEVLGLPRKSLRFRKNLLDDVMAALSLRVLGFSECDHDLGMRGVDGGDGTGAGIVDRSVERDIERKEAEEDSASAAAILEGFLRGLTPLARWTVEHRWGLCEEGEPTSLVEMARASGFTFRKMQRVNEDAMRTLRKMAGVAKLA